MNEESYINQIVQNYRKISYRLSTYSYDGNHPQFVIVTKNQPIDLILKLSQRIKRPIFGENRVQEALPKIKKCQNSEVKWHFIGHLQRNKVKHVIGKFELIQSLDSLTLANEIQKTAIKQDIIVNCLLQIDVCQNGSKFGLNSEEETIKEFLLEMKDFSHLNILGLMTIAPLIAVEETRKYFRLMNKLFNNLKQDSSIPLNTKMNILSMGMSNDYEIALQEGSTMVRLGTALFESSR